MADDPLDDFTAEDVTLRGDTRRVYHKGTGPAVIVIAEMPGISRRSPTWPDASPISVPPR